MKFHIIKNKNKKWSVVYKPIGAPIGDHTLVELESFDTEKEAKLYIDEYNKAINEQMVEENIDAMKESIIGMEGNRE